MHGKQKITYIHKGGKHDGKVAGIVVIQFNGHPKGIVYGVYEGVFFCEASYLIYEYVPGISYILPYPQLLKLKKSIEPFFEK